MAVLGQAGVRKEPFDRTWVDVGVLAANTGPVAPHGSTSRWSFTCPSNKRATVGFAQVWWYRNTAAAPVGEISDKVFYTPSGGTIRVVLEAVSIKNAIGDEAHAEMGAQLTLQSGDVLSGFTYDLGTGGTSTFRVTAQVNQYDV